MYTLPYHAGKRFHEALILWWEQNVVAPDPDPRYSYLDRLDGLNERKAR